jgi:hypothetical protein
MKTLTRILSLVLITAFIACEPNDTVEPTPPSDGDLIEPNVGGPDQPNQVFIDLSTGVTTAVDKDNWDLGFATGDDFKVVLNYAAHVVARATEETNLDNVTSTLVTEEYKAETVVAPEGNIEWIDNPNGDLAETAIATVSATEDQNVVYVVNRGQIEEGGNLVERGFLKIKVNRQEAGYSITYGDIDATTYETVTIAKDSKYNFTFFSFDDGVVTVEPEKNLWDLEMTTTSNYFFDRENNETVPYKFKDYSIMNYGNVKVASVDVTEEVTYVDFTINDALALTLENNRLGIGGTWRKFDFASFSYTINPDIFYVIEDTEGNLYKLQFTRMLCVEAACAGERGYPEFTYELLKDE